MHREVVYATDKVTSPITWTAHLTSVRAPLPFAKRPLHSPTGLGKALMQISSIAPPQVRERRKICAMFRKMER